MIVEASRLCRKGSIPIFAIVLSSCGGAGNEVGKCYSPNPAICSAVGVDRSFPQPSQSPVGLYKGISGNGRAITALVFNDNSFYTIYSGVNNPSIAGGAVQGTLRAEGGDFAVADAVDFNAEGLGVQVVGVAGKYGEKQYMQGSVGYPLSGQTIDFYANYNADFELTPSLSTIAGRYVGRSASSVGSETVTIDISGAGNVNGTGSSGCTFSGDIKPRTSGNAYLLTVTFGASPCRYPGAKLSGISYFDRTSNMAYTVASLAGQNAGFVAITTKQ